MIEIAAQIMAPIDQGHVRVLAKGLVCPLCTLGSVHGRRPPQQPC